MDTLIYIDEKDKKEASVAANAFANKDIRNRAYINTLGAELALKYLASEYIDVSNTKNLHSIKKILEEIDISDIMLENIHIDVRVIFDENAIFIPKSHFKYELTPDIYLVFNLAKDYSHVKFIGFFKPELINKNNANADYYFIEKEKLSPADELINYIKAHRGNTNRELSDDDMENSERIIVSMTDNDVSENDKTYLIKQLLKNAELREKFIEYENFETLSYKAMNDPEIKKREIINNQLETSDKEFSNLNNINENDFLDEFAFDENISETPDNFDNATDITNETPQQDDEFTNISDFESLSNIEENIIPDAINIDSIEFDNIELPEIQEDRSNSDIETIALEEVDTNNFETEESPQFNEETIALEEVDTNNFETEESPQFNEETIALEEVDTNNFETEESPQFNEETIALEEVDINNFETEESPQFNEETIALEEVDTNNFETEEGPNVGISNFDEINIPEPQTDTEVTNPNNSEFNSIDSIENMIANEMPDIIFSDNSENAETNNETSTFGKNLIENLSYTNDVEIVNNIEPANDDEITDYQIQNDEIVAANDLITETIDDEIAPENVEYTEELIESDENPQDEADKLNILYNETDLDAPIDENIQEALPTDTVPGVALYDRKNDNKKIITAVLLLTVLAIGTTFIFLKPKSNNDIEPITTTAEIPTTPPQNDDILANTPPNTANKSIQTTEPAIKELKNNPPKSTNSELSLNVNKLVWDVPDTLAYSTKMQNYLKTAGKSIKLSLSADLLLATEYAYTNQIKVGLQLGKNGAIQDARILSSSGSTQIDNIVLQSVKETLNVVKPPSDEIIPSDFNLNLIIYF